MFNRMDSHLDIDARYVPEDGLIGFRRTPDGSMVEPIYRVTQADWDDLPNYWKKRRSMTTLDVIKRELTELKRKADGIVQDERAYTQELRALAFDLSAKIGSAIESCEMPVTTKGPF